MTKGPMQTSGGMTPEDRRIFLRFVVFMSVVEVAIILVVGWHRGVTWAVIAAAVLGAGVGYALVGMRKNLIRRHQQPEG